MNARRLMRALALAVLAAAAVAVPGGSLLAAPPPAPSAPAPAAPRSWWQDALKLHAEAMERMKQNDFDGAIPLLEKALTLSEANKSDDYVLLTLNLLTMPYTAKRDPAKVEALHRRMLALREKTSGPDSPFTAMELNNFADFYRQTGQYDRAEPLFRRAIDIYEKAGGPARLGGTVAMNNLALLHVSKGDSARAEELLRRALDIQKASAGPDNPVVANTIANLAIIAHHRGDLPAAEELDRSACAALEKAFTAEHYATAQCFLNLGAVLQSKADYPAARALFEKALGVRQRVLGPSHPRVADSLNVLAQLKEAMGEPAQAVADLDAAAEIADRDMELVLAVGSERQKKEFLARYTVQTEGILSLQMGAAKADPAALRLAVRTVLRRKGRVLDALSQATAALRSRMSPADRQILDELNAARAKLAGLVLNGPSAPGGDRQSLMEQARQDVERLEGEVARRSSAYRVRALAASIEGVQAAIPEGAALVEIARYRPFNVKWRARDEAWRAPRYAAYVMRRAGDPEAIDLGDAAAIDGAIGKLRRALADPESRDVKRLAEDVDARVLRPILAKMQAASTRPSMLFVSPDGTLNLIPFGALVDEAGHYRIETIAFTYLTAGRDLLRMQVEAPPRGKPLVVANPNFGTEAPTGVDGRASAPSIRMLFPPLPATAAEGVALGKTLEGAALVTGAQATEEVLKNAQGPEVLHVATHGFFLANPMSIAGNTRALELEMANVAAGAGGAPKGPSLPLDQPLLLSGIALAGANHRGDGKEDGVVTALEASGLDLWGTRLVVLSACETGLGGLEGGEGVYGLRRALVIAGAESLVMSLWKVDDEATRDLMIAYYRKLARGGGRTGALREAQLELLATAPRSHPYFWASFIPSGDFRPVHLTLASRSAAGAAAGAGPAKVEPGARGCGCELVASPGVSGVWALAGLAALVARITAGRTRRRRRRGW